MGGNISDTWTEARVDRLKALWGSEMSAREIAAELGIPSRNAVIGKALRLGLGKRTSAGTNEPTVTKIIRRHRHTEGSVARIIRKAKRAEIIAEPFVIRDAVEVEPRHLNLLDLEHDDCRWPYGEGPFTFCGCKVIKAGPYCHAHTRLSEGLGTPSERAVAPLRRREAA